MPATAFDVAILDDFRSESPGVVAEVHAQADAALTTVLVHAPEKDNKRQGFGTAVTELVRSGRAALARDDQPVTARLLIVRRAALLTDGLLRKVQAARIVVVAAEPPSDGHAGKAVEWAPVDERVRAAMPISCRLTPHDWPVITDMASWWRDNRGRFSETPGEVFRRLDRRHGHHAHLRRLAGFGIRPRINAPARRREAARAEEGPARRLLLVSDDAGAYLDGFLTEHLPSEGMVPDRVDHLIDLHRPEAVAVAGPLPEGIADVVRDHPGLAWGWVRGDRVFDLSEEGTDAAPVATWLSGLAARERIGG